MAIVNSYILLAYFPYFEKIKVGLWNDHALCVSVYPPLWTFECMNAVYIMVLKPIWTAYFINATHQALCFYVYVASQRLGKNFTSARSTQATIEELLDASFCMQSVSYARKVGD
jgi:hypothetical protein